MASYSFKHVGNSVQSLATAPVAAARPIGIKTPMQISNADGILVLHYSLEDQLHDNLKNLLLTNWGERLGLYDFGANLKPITTELATEQDYDIEAMTRIKAAVSRWMPYVNLINFSVEDSKTFAGVSIKKLTITYEIPNLSTTERAIQIVLNMI